MVIKLEISESNKFWFQNGRLWRTLNQPPVISKDGVKIWCTFDGSPTTNPEEKHEIIIDIDLCIKCNLLQSV